MMNILHQAIKFIGLSGIGWLIDMTAYLALTNFSADLALNNMVSSFLGLTFVFSFSTRFVFQNNSRIALKWKYLIYLAYQVVLIGIVSHLLVYIYDILYSFLSYWHLAAFTALGAKIAVTPVTMILNFVVMKTVTEKI